MKPVTYAMFFVGLAIAGAGSSGCAPAKLTVHVDLYRSELPSNNIGPENESFLDAILEYEAATKGLFSAYKTAVATLYSGFNEGPQETRTNLLNQAAALETEINKQFLAAKNDIVESKTLAKQAESASDPLERMNLEVQSQKRTLDATAKILVVDNWIAAQFSEADIADRKISYSLFTEQWPETLVNMKENAKKNSVATQDLDAFQKMLNELRESLLTIAADTAGLGAKLADEAMYIARHTNPDLLADDGDPNLRMIAGHAAWKNDFYVQSIYADGRSSFVIVRETPTRFKVSRAQSDPTVLIKTQLRLARAGLQAVASIANGIVAAYVNTPEGPDKDGNPLDRLGPLKGQLPAVVQTIFEARTSGESNKDSASNVATGLSDLLKKVQEEHDKIKEELAKATKDEEKTAIQAKAESYFANTLRPAIEQYVKKLETTSASTSGS